MGSAAAGPAADSVKVTPPSAEYSSVWIDVEPSGAALPDSVWVQIASNDHTTAAQLCPNFYGQSAIISSQIPSDAQVQVFGAGAGNGSLALTFVKDAQSVSQTRQAVSIAQGTAPADALPCNSGASKPNTPGSGAETSGSGTKNPGTGTPGSDTKTPGTKTPASSSGPSNSGTRTDQTPDSKTLGSDHTPGGTVADSHGQPSASGAEDSAQTPGSDDANQSGTSGNNANGGPQGSESDSSTSQQNQAANGGAAGTKGTDQLDQAKQSAGSKHAGVLSKTGAAVGGVLVAVAITGGVGMALLRRRSNGRNN